MQGIEKAAGIISGWNCPLLTFIYPSFDCGSNGIARCGNCSDTLPACKVDLRRSNACASPAPVTLEAMTELGWELLFFLHHMGALFFLFPLFCVVLKGGQKETQSYVGGTAKKKADPYFCLLEPTHTLSTWAKPLQATMQKSAIQGRRGIHAHH